MQKSRKRRDNIVLYLGKDVELYKALRQLAQQKGEAIQEIAKIGLWRYVRKQQRKRR